MTTCERRRHPRYRPALPLFTRSPSHIGIVVNIGLGGMAIEYISDGTDAPPIRHLDIFCGSKAHEGIAALPVRVVHQQAATAALLHSELQAKRLSMAFGPLSQRQKHLLTELLAHCTPIAN